MLVSDEQTHQLGNLMEAVTAATGRHEKRHEPRLGNYRARGLRVEVPGDFVPPVFRDAHWRPANLAGFRLQLCDESDRGADHDPRQGELS